VTVVNVLRSLAANFISLLLSLILAVFIWSVAVRDNDPEDSIQLEVPLQVIGRPAEHTVTGIPDSVGIGLRGPESVINQLSREDFVAELDLTEVGPGETAVPINVRFNVQAIELVWQVPQETAVLIERLVTREVPVQLDVEGSVARGYVMGETFVDPGAISVSGVASRVDALAEARVTVFLDNPQQDVVVTRRPIFFDQQGNITSVSSLDVSTDQVVVTVPVDQLAGFAAKPIIVNWQGEPAQGYRLLDVSVEPDSVLVTGSPEQLDRLTRVQTEPIDISGLRESRTMQVALDLPSGVELDEVQPVFVEIEIEPILTSSVMDVDEVRVFLFGPLDKLDSLVEDDVRVTIDLFGLDIGEHSLEPDADVFVSGIEVRSIQPPQVTVNLTHTVTETGELTTTAETSATDFPAPSTASSAAALSILLVLLGMPALGIPASILTWRRERRRQ
jgi:YbbR domain-containing protein